MQRILNGVRKGWDTLLCLWRAVTIVQTRTGMGMWQGWESSSRAWAFPISALSQPHPLEARESCIIWDAPGVVLGQDWSRAALFIHSLLIQALFLPMAGPLPDYIPPEVFSFESSTGFTLYGMMYKPHNLQPGKKYPTVLFIYGGPQVSAVCGQWAGLDHFIPSSRVCTAPALCWG